VRQRTSPSRNAKNVRVMILLGDRDCSDVLASPFRELPVIGLEPVL
jgi:hypothetical protein